MADENLPLLASFISAYRLCSEQGRAPKQASIVQGWLGGESKPLALQTDWDTKQTLLRTGSIWGLDKHARGAMWSGWEATYKEAAEVFAKKVALHDNYARELSELQLQRDLHRVRDARVVGCTTTGAAIHHALLTEAGCGVVLVEEAAEVLEAHVLTALDTSTKHLIMIGEASQT